MGAAWITNKGWEEGVAGDWVFTNLSCAISVSTDTPKAGTYNLHIAPIFSDAAQWAQARFSITDSDIVTYLKGKQMTFSINRYITSADTVTRLSADELYIRITDNAGTTQTLCGYVNPDMWIAHSVARTIDNTATYIYIDIYYSKPLNAHRHHFDIDDMEVTVLLAGGQSVAGYVYPTDVITRVTSLIHRYNRATGEYNLEIGLGEVAADFAIPKVDLITGSSSPKKQEAQVEEKVAQAVIPQIPGKVMAPAGAVTGFAEFLAGETRKPKVPEILTPAQAAAVTGGGAATGRYGAQVRATAITEAIRRAEEPGALTARTIEILRAAQTRQAVQKIEEQIAQARMARGEAMPVTEYTQRIIRESPEAQRRLKEIQEKRKKWWEF